MAGSDLVARLGVDSSAWTSGFAKSRSTASSFALSIGSTLAPIGNAVAAAGVAISAGAIAAAGAAVGMGVKLAAEAEQSNIAFDVMLGSAEKAQAMLAGLTEYANHSPFDIAGTQDAAKQLLNYGIAAGDVIPTIKLLGDVAAGDMSKFKGLATAFGQMSATGKLAGDDLHQFINAGFNPLQEIAAKTGESMETLKKRMEKGGVSASEVTKAFQAATSEGGRFFGMTERQSGTIIGKFNTMKDGVSQALKTIGTELITRFHLSQVLDNMTASLEQVPGFFVETMDAIWPIVQAGIEGLTPIFTWMNDTIRPAIAEIPFFFRNATPLIEATVLDWNVALFEFVPGSAETMETVGTIIISTWDGIAASAAIMVENVGNSLKKLASIVSAVWAGINAGGDDNAIVSGFKAGMDEWNKKSDAGTGKNFITEFSKAFNETFQNATEGIKDQGGFKSIYKAKKDDLINGITESEAARAVVPLLKAPDLSILGGSTSGVAQAVSGGDKSAQAKAALFGSSDAAAIFTRGIGGDKDDTAKKSLSVQEKALTAQERTAAAVENMNSDQSEVADIQ